MNFGYNLLTDCKLSTFAKNILNFYRPHLPEVRIRGVMPCHRMAHCVLIRCFLLPSLSEALCLCNFFSIKDGPHLPEVRVGREAILSLHGALRAYTVFLTDRASARLYLGVIFVRNYLRLGHKCLPEDNHSRMSPTYPEEVVFYMLS